MKTFYKVLLGILFLCITSISTAQTTKEEVFDNIKQTGGVYFAYPSDKIKPETPSPKGYKPFYISHFSRHGSRYLISDSEYKDVLDLLVKAKQEKALTPLGKETLHRLQKVWEEVEHRGGDLSPLGVREHKGIAERMYQSYPEVFEKDASIYACATTVMRCALSMDAFCERLKELNPNLQTHRDASMFHQRYLNHHTKEAVAWRSAPDTWRIEYNKFEQEHIKPNRLVQSIFSDDTFVLRKVNPKDFMWGMYWIASGMQNIETETSFYDLFEKQELFDIWQCHNYQRYACDANYALNNGLMFENNKPMLRNILDEAEKAINSNKRGANLRFAHDGNLVPMALLLHLEGCYESIENPYDFYKVWSDFKITPMAGNIQLVFYKSRDKNEPILVKFLLHENEVLVPPIKTNNAPYYEWNDVKEFYEDLLLSK